MKKKISLIMILLLLVQMAWMDPYNNPYDYTQYVQEYRAIDLPENIPVTYTGMTGTSSKISQYNFTDVSGQDKINATRLAQFDITKGIGGQKFGASATISNIEVLAMLVRMFGNDQTIRNTVVANNPGVTGAALTGAFYDAYYQQAKVLGILTPLEDVAYVAPAKRENIAVWLIRASGIEAEFTQNALYQATDWQQIKIENLDEVETVVDQNIMPLVAGKFDPNGAMIRKDFAGVLAQVFDQFSETLNVTSRYGLVVGLKENATTQGTNYDIYVRDVDNSLVRIQTTTPKTGSATGLVVYKGTLTDHKALKVGDEINYLVQNNQVRYAVVLSAGQVKDRLVQYFDTFTDVEVRQGIVLSTTPESLNFSGLNQENTRVRIELDDDDAMVDLVSVNDKITGIRNDFIVMDGLEYKSVADLKPNDAVTLYTQGNDILKVLVGKLEVKEVKGTLRMVDQTSTPAQIVMFDYDNQLMILQVDKDAEISVNFYPATLEDLKPGANTAVRVVNNKVVHLVSDSYQPVPGYIPREGKIKYATIKTISGNTLTLTGETTKYELGPATLVQKDGTKLNLSALRTGDKIKLYFDNIYSKVPSRIVVEGKEQLVREVLKGTVYNYNQFTDQLSVNNRYRLQNTLWVREHQPNEETLKLASQVQIFANGKAISREDINKTYKQTEAYYIVKDNFGSKEIVQIHFKKGYEKNYTEAIKDYSTVLNRFELKNNRNVLYDDATIFVKDNRLVSESDLRDNANVFVVANQVSGADQAMLVRIVGNYDTIYDKVYVGAVEDVNSYSLLLSNFTSVSDYNWAKVDQGEKLLAMSDETQIYDYAKDKTITRTEFFNGSYSRNENDSTDGKGLAKERYYGIFVTDGADNVLAMKLRFKELIKGQNIDDVQTSESKVDDVLNDTLDDTVLTVGHIGEFNNQWKRVGLVDSYNFMRHHGEWEPNTVQTYVELTDALIVKNDKPITYDDLKLDDRVYIIRYDEDALVVFVEP